MGIDITAIDWGPDEAKGDARLGEYFVEVPRYDKILSGQCRYVVGRKGTGKTAICERIRLAAAEDPCVFAHTLSLKNFPLARIRDLRDEAYHDKAQFVPVWSFLLVVEIARLVLEDCSVQPVHVREELAEFISTNFPESSIGFTETLTTLNKSDKRVSVGGGWLKSESLRLGQVEHTSSVHYQKVTDLLLKKLASLNSDSRYHILMDELDEGYEAKDKGLQLILLALLRATENVYLALKNARIIFCPVLVLRSDIFSRLEDNDLNKLDDHLIQLRWLAHPFRPYSLQDIVSARITASAGDVDLDDPWENIVDSGAERLSDDAGEIWWHLISRTLHRPRDILKYLKVCADVAKAPGFTTSRGLTLDIATQAEYVYSQWFFKEIRDELHGHLSVWRGSAVCRSARRRWLSVG